MNDNYEEVILYDYTLNAFPVYGFNDRFIITKDFSFEYTSPYWNYNFIIGLNKFNKLSVIDPDSLDQTSPININKSICKIINTTVYPYLIFDDRSENNTLLFDLEREQSIIKNYPIHDYKVRLLDYNKIGETELFLCKNQRNFEQIQIYTENEVIFNFGLNNYKYVTYGFISKTKNNIILCLRSRPSKFTLLTFDLRYNKDPINRIFYDMKSQMIYPSNKISVDEKFVYLTAPNKNVFGLSINKKNIESVDFNNLSGTGYHSFYTDYCGYTELLKSETLLIQDKLNLIKRLTSLRKLLFIFLTKIEYNIT